MVIFKLSQIKTLQAKKYFQNNTEVLTTVETTQFQEPNAPRAHSVQLKLRILCMLYLLTAAGISSLTSSNWTKVHNFLLFIKILSSK